MNERTDHAPRPPRVVFFDLGNVLLFFDHQRAARQLAALAGVDPQRIWQFVFESDLNHRCDAGLVSAPEFCEIFRREMKCQTDDAAIIHASSDIFTPNLPMIGIAAQLTSQRYRIGIISNTCDMHRAFFCSGRYGLIPGAFNPLVMSYELKLMKPDAAIYLHAAKLAGVEAGEILFVDDLERNVLGARAAGLQAVQYTTPRAFVAALRSAGISLSW